MDGPQKDLQRAHKLSQMMGMKGGIGQLQGNLKQMGFAGKQFAQPGTENLAPGMHPVKPKAKNGAQGAQGAQKPGGCQSCQQAGGPGIGGPGGPGSGTGGGGVKKMAAVLLQAINQMEKGGIG